MFPVNYMAMGIIFQTRQKNHGYGLKSVKEVVEKYNGTIEIKTDNNIFTITVVLYVE